MHILIYVFRTLISYITFSLILHIVNWIVSNIQPGDVILAHDVHPHTVELTRLLLSRLSVLGYRSVTVSEMIGRYGMRRQGQ